MNPQPPAPVRVLPKTYEELRRQDGQDSQGLGRGRGNGNELSNGRFVQLKKRGRDEDEERVLQDALRRERRRSRSRPPSPIRRSPPRRYDFKRERSRMSRSPPRSPPPRRPEFDRRYRGRMRSPLSPRPGIGMNELFPDRHCQQKSSKPPLFSRLEDGPRYRY